MVNCNLFVSDFYVFRNILTGTKCIESIRALVMSMYNGRDFIVIIQIILIELLKTGVINLLHISYSAQYQHLPQFEFIFLKEICAMMDMSKPFFWVFTLYDV